MLTTVFLYSSFWFVALSLFSPMMLADDVRKLLRRPLFATDAAPLLTHLRPILARDKTQKDGIKTRVS